MAIPLGHLGVAAGRTLGGIGRGRLLGKQIELEEGDHDRQAMSEMLRLSLAQRSADRQDSGDAALRDYLTSHGAGDLASLPGGPAMTEFGRRNPPAARPSASEGRVSNQEAHKARVAAARGELKGLITRTLSSPRSPGGTAPKPRSPDAMFAFLRTKFPDLADADLWDIIGDFTIPKKAPGAGGSLDLTDLKASLSP